MKLIVHRGGNQIGGSCVEIATARTRVILDVGLPFEEEQQDQLPDVPGLFSAGDRVDAIVLSHAHFDHTGLLLKTNPEIPVYCTSGTSKMMLAGALFARQCELPKERYRQLSTGVPRHIGDLTVTVFDVDHSIFGSVAIMVEGDGERILYSGDLRMHGRKPGMIAALYKALKDRPVDTLIMEGTLVGLPPKRALTEREIEPAILESIKTAPSLVLATFSPQNLDRLVTIYRATKRAGRIFVADLYTAFIMHLLKSEVKIPPPRSSEGVAVFFNRTKPIPQKIRDLFTDSQITLDEIRAEPTRYVMVGRPGMVKADFKSVLPEGSRCLYSMWSGYLDRPEWKETQSVLAAANGDLVRHHAGGHITVEDIQRFIERVNPKRVVPIHTRDPSGFSDFGQNITAIHNFNDNAL